MHFYTILIFLGLFGLMGSTILFPIIFRIFNFKNIVKSEQSENKGRKGTIHVLIPAHNEEKTIEQTVHSILNAGHKSNKDIQIYVAVDNSTDQTFEKCRELKLNNIFKTDNRNKWKNLVFLLDLIEAEADDWVALVDSGTIWSENIIDELNHSMNSEIIGFAPKYWPKKMSFAEKISWGVEATCKVYENFAGGPISIHGATVFYKNENLKKALQFLKSKKEEFWLVDDVVIPLTLRLLFKDKNIYYSDLATIDDIGLEKVSNEAGRRKRLVIGNFQWIKKIYLEELKNNINLPILVGLRRIFRLIWGYWVLFVLFGSIGLVANVMFSNFIFSILFGFVALIIFNTSLKLIIPSLYAAFMMSIKTPALIYKFRSINEVEWS